MNNYRQPYSRGPASYGQNSSCCQSNTAGASYTNQVNSAASDCSCSSYSNDMFGFPLAMAYVPWQPWCNLYSTEQALYKGTLFQELDLDFMGRRCN